MRFVEGLCRDQLVSYVLDDIIAEEHYVRLMDQMATGFYQANPGLFSDKGSRATGRKAYHPALLLGIWLYGYLNGVSSSRKLERECQRNIELHWLSQRLVPDHKTLANFRKAQRAAIQHFTRQFTRLLRQAGYISEHTLAVDGSKLRACASQSYTVTSLGEQLRDTDRKLTLYVDQLQAPDEQGEPMERWEPRRNWLLAQMEGLEAKQATLIHCQAAAQQKPAKRISPTDVEARIMKGRQGKHYSYNLQTAVDSTFGFIAGYQVSNHENDKGLLEPMVELLRDETALQPGQLLADAGYHDTKQIQSLEAQGITCYVAPNDNQQQGQEQQGISFTYEAALDQYRCSQGRVLTKKYGLKRDNRRGTLMQTYVGTACQDCHLKTLCTKAAARHVYRHHDQPWRDAYRKKMESAVGQQRLKQRMALVEHPFGTLKERMGHTPLLLRGLKNVASEVGLYVLGYNFTRLNNLVSFQTIQALIQPQNWKINRYLSLGNPLCLFGGSLTSQPPMLW